MIAKFSLAIQKEITNIHQKDQKLADRIEKQIALFEENPKHPSLRTHKLSGNMDDMWSISVTMSIRMVYILVDKDTVLFVKMGAHEDVYEK